MECKERMEGMERVEWNYGGMERVEWNWGKTVSRVNQKEWNWGKTVSRVNQKHYRESNPGVSEAGTKHSVSESTPWSHQPVHLYCQDNVV